VGVVKEAIEDGVPEGGVANEFVPVVRGDLARDEGGTAVVPVIEDFEEIAPAEVVEGSEAKVIEDEELGTGQALQEPGMGAVAPGEGELGEEAGETVVPCGQAVTTGLVAEGAGQVGLPGAGGSHDQDTLALADPVATAEAEDERAIEAPGRSEVEVLDGGVEMETGLAEEALKTPVGPFTLFAFQEEDETVVEVEVLDIGQALLFLESRGHARKAELVEEVEGGLAEHGHSPFEDEESR
jgi:hypothetical protein